MKLRRKWADYIKSISAFCSQHSTSYIFSVPLFCDAAGEGIIAFLAGASFRVKVKSKDEFGKDLLTLGQGKWIRSMGFNHGISASGRVAYS